MSFFCTFPIHFFITSVTPVINFFLIVYCFNMEFQFVFGVCFIHTILTHLSFDPLVVPFHTSLSDLLLLHYLIHTCICMVLDNMPFKYFPVCKLLLTCVTFIFIALTTCVYMVLKRHLVIGNFWTFGELCSSLGRISSLRLRTISFTRLGLDMLWDLHFFNV